ncbi:MAG TPA: Asp23/Gls24 family envelope stress response protein [Candidatus Corynebacterium avicola]|uniref:Asp23/Gls24 family envelope stress response protein n=1 Tax=Candidatus Corynebacterium avicola TaxID=2838527 RepID=A0A9D1UKP9_9CORY|nr:Asp23/Gls24 family envelope stress response protein [Candidatus Corynebacterium avicola]
MSTAVDPDRSTTISSRVVEKVATRATREIPGVIDHSSGLGQFAGRGYPRVSAHLISDVGGGRIAADIDVQIATRWPAPTVTIAQLAREVVAEWVEAYTGMTVRSVNVDVGAVVPLPDKPEDEARITVGELDATPRTPLLAKVTATPLRPYSPTTTRRIAEPEHPVAPESVDLSPVVTAQRSSVQRIDAPTEPSVTAARPPQPVAPTLTPVTQTRRRPVRRPATPGTPTVTHPVAPPDPKVTRPVAPTHPYVEHLMVPPARPVQRPVSPHSELNPPVTTRVHVDHRPVVTPPPQYGLRLLADVVTPTGPSLRAVPTPRGLQPRAVPTPQGLPVTIVPQVTRHGVTPVTVDRRGLTPVTVDRHPRITPTAPRDRRSDRRSDDGRKTS